MQNTNIKKQNSEQEEEKEKRKHPILLIFLYILTLLMFILSGSFTLSTILNAKQSNIDEIQVGQVKMEFIDNKDTNIKLIDTYPMKEEKAKSLTPFKFKIINEGTLPVIYRLKLQDVKDEEILKDINLEKLNHEKINYSLIDSDTKEIISKGLISNLNDDILITEKLLPIYYRNFEFRIWVNENAGNEAQNKYYVGEIILEIDEILKQGDE